MIRSMYSGVSGLRALQTKMDVIGNNIANVNTVGFKKSRTQFQDVLSANLNGASAPVANRGGVNPKQVGLGTRVSAIEVIHTTGSPNITNLPNDLAVFGDAFFVVAPEPDDPASKEKFLTRAGNFTRDSKGYLVNSNGLFLTGVTDDGNPDPALRVTNEHKILVNKDEVAGKDLLSYTYDANGSINVVDVDGKIGKLAINAANQYYLNDGSDPATLNEIISIGTAVVTNASGLSKKGDALYEMTLNANPNGQLKVDRIQNNYGGQIVSGQLEMSNVDLTEEFTDMIVTQRAFQANSRVVTTSDSLLEEVINLKR